MSESKGFIFTGEKSPDKNGFIFDGVDIANFGLQYAPELSQTYVYGGAPNKNHEEYFDGSDGAYYYGSTTQPKDFRQRCIFEGQHINRGMMMNIEGLFRRGRTGKLIFKNRPWCYYMATILKSVSFTDLKSYQSGILTIELRAYYPYARSDQKMIWRDIRGTKTWPISNIPDNCQGADIIPVYSNTGGVETFVNSVDANEESLLANTGMFQHDLWLIGNAVADNAYSAGMKYDRGTINGNNTANPIRDYIFYNPGTEYAETIIRVAGNVGDGIEITNNTTGQTCRIIGLRKGNTTNQGEEWVIDSLSGKTVIANESTGVVVENGYMYHDGGFIQFAPCTPMLRTHAKIPMSAGGTAGGTKALAICGENGEDMSYAVHEDMADGNHYVIINYSYGTNSLKRGLFRINTVNSRESIIYLDHISVASNGNEYIANDNDSYSMSSMFANNKTVIDITIVKMNRITLRKLGSTCNLTKLEFDFKPTFA